MVFIRTDYMTYFLVMVVIVVGLLLILLPLFVVCIGRPSAGEI